MFCYVLFRVHQSKKVKQVRSYRTVYTKPYEDLHIKKYELHGIDISKHQGKVDWEKVKHPDDSLNIDFVFIRSNYGNYVDRTFKGNWEQASKNNFIIGAYHYYWPNLNSTIQADIFIKTVKLEPGNLPPVLDVESLPSKQSKANWRKGLKNWIYLIEKHYGALPIIYTSDTFYRHQLKVDPFFKDYKRLWIANYNKIESPISNWHFWQVSDKVRIPGIKEKVDYNVYKENILEFNKMLISE